MTHSRTTTPTLPARVSTVGVVVLCSGSTLAAVGSAWAIVTNPTNKLEIPTTAAAATTCAAAILLLGIAALASALVPRAARRTDAAAAVAMLALSWSAIVPLISPGTPTAVRHAAFMVAAVLPAALLHLAAALSPTPLPRWPIPTAYAVIALLAIARSLVTAPFLDLDCRIDCDVQGIVIEAAPTASHVFGGALSIASAIAASVAAAYAAIAIAVDGRRRRPPRVLISTIAVIAIIQVVVIFPVAGRPVLGPLPPLGDAVLVTKSVLTAALAVGLLVRAWRLVRRASALRTSLERAARAGQSPALEGVLASALRDPHLRLEFWLATLGRWSDAAGAAADADHAAVHGIVTISDRGEIVARVRPGRRDVDPAELLTVIGPAAVLLIDNERLRVERLAQTSAVRESLLRIVETADTARRQLERDLHDGAQQRLLAAILAYRGAADADGSPVAKAGVAAELQVVLDVLDAVRETAQGVYPPVLADSGLVPALEALVRAAPGPVSLTAPSLPRLDSSVEFTLYLAAREGLTRSADGATAVTLRRQANIISLEISPSRVRTERLADRVGAVGGSIRHHDGTVTVEVPCA